MKAIHWYILSFGALLCLPGTHLFAEESFTESLETAFIDGGQIEIKLSSGNHTISSSEDDHIRIFWRAKIKDIANVDAHTRVDGSKAVIDIDGPNKDFHTTIEVPRHSDLKVHLSAGELHVENIEGDRDIKFRAGELKIEIGSPDDYARVEGSLWAGDIDAGPFEIRKSGLFRSIEWEGEGSHSLQFKLYAGDVTLYQKGE